MTESRIIITGAAGQIGQDFDRPRPGEVRDGSGQAKIDCIDLVRAVKAASGARAMVARIPYRLFHLMLATCALVDRDAPFTPRPPAGLAVPEGFPARDRPWIFGVGPEPLGCAADETFRHRVRPKVVLEF